MQFTIVNPAYSRSQSRYPVREFASVEAAMSGMLPANHEQVGCLLVERRPSSEPGLRWTEHAVARSHKTGSGAVGWTPIETYRI